MKGVLKFLMLHGLKECIFYGKKTTVVRTTVLLIWTFKYVSFFILVVTSVAPSSANLQDVENWLTLHFLLLLSSRATGNSKCREYLWKTPFFSSQKIIGWERGKKNEVDDASSVLLLTDWYRQNNYQTESCGSIVSFIHLRAKSVGPSYYKY